MNVTDHYRTTLDELTHERPGEVDLATVISGGRRRRRVRRTAWAGGALAIAAVAASTGILLHRDARHVAVDQGSGPATAGSSYQDFVPGTDIDEVVQETVARHVPSVPAAEDVYPSDWNTPGPIPDADHADATEWHAVYQLSASERLTVLMSQAIPGQPVTLTCDDVQQVDLPCVRTEEPDGSLDMRFGTVTNNMTTYRFLTVHVSSDGFVTETLDDVQAQSWIGARATRQLTDGALSTLVRDPALTFPAPVHTPPSPAPQM